VVKRRDKAVVFELVFGDYAVQLPDCLAPVVLPALLFIVGHLHFNVHEDLLVHQFDDLLQGRQLELLFECPILLKGALKDVVPVELSVLVPEVNLTGITAVDDNQLVVKSEPNLKSIVKVE
jgi:hypothetical protein